MTQMASDIAIIGGGPVGLATAIRARMAGLTVTLYEPKSGPIDKACGEGLMPSAIRHLAKLGVHPKRSHIFRGIRYINQGQSATGNFWQGAGSGVRRLDLHKALTERLTELGVEHRSTRAQQITQQDNAVEVDGDQYRYVIAADGLNSPIRAKLELDLPPKRPKRLGLRQHFRQRPWSEYVEVYWSPYAEAYVTPVAEDEVGVAILFYKDHAPKGQHKYQQLLQHFPELLERLDQSQPCSTVRGAGPFERRVRTPLKGNILLVGDSAGYLDPLTGEGIRLGLDASEAAIAAIVAERPQLYHKSWKRFTRKYWVMTDGLLRLRSVPFLRKLMVPALRFIPGLFSAIISTLAAD